MLERFIRLPFALHAADPNWVPPLLADRREALSSQRNPLFQHAAAAHWILRRDGRDIGRISAVDDRAAPVGPEGDRPGHFGSFAAEDDPAAIAMLIGAAEQWLRSKGRRRVLGPFSLSINEEAGLLVKGFDTAPMLMMPHDLPHLGPALEQLGYGRERDLLCFLFDLSRPLPPGPSRMLERGLPEGMRVRRLRMRDYRAEVATIVDIFNDAWSGNWGFSPLTPAELDHMATRMRPLVHEDLVWFAELNGEPVGFIVGLPNINEAIRDLGGRLLPFGWLKLLWRLRVRGLRTARVPLMGVRRAHASGMAGAMLPFLLIDAARQAGLARGMRMVELSWVLDNNAPMRRIGEALGATQHRTYRIYGKSLMT